MQGSVVNEKTRGSFKPCRPISFSIQLGACGTACYPIASLIQNGLTELQLSFVFDIVPYIKKMDTKRRLSCSLSVIHQANWIITCWDLTQWFRRYYVAKTTSTVDAYYWQVKHRKNCTRERDQIIIIAHASLPFLLRTKMCRTHSNITEQCTEDRTSKTVLFGLPRKRTSIRQPRIEPGLRS